MIMLSKLEEAIKELEQKKKELIQEIENSGWDDNRVETPIPSEIKYRFGIKKFVETPEEKAFPQKIKVMYQQWYAAARTIIARNYSARLPEFDALYSCQTGYCIKFFLEDLYLNQKDEFKLIDLINAQFGILASVPNHLKFSVYNTELNIYSVLMKDELGAAQYLLDNGFLRSAGALAGIVLERHLKNLLEKHEPPIKYRERAALGELNKLCGENNIYEPTDKSRVDVLNQIRIRCVHDKEPKPKKEEVQGLIDGVSKTIGNYLTPLMSP